MSRGAELLKALPRRRVSSIPRSDLVIQTNLITQSIPSMKLPEQTFKKGWPKFLSDTDSERYVRVRDGSSTGPFSGNSCLYARLDSENRLLRNRLYVPRLGASDGDIVMSGGSWLSEEEAENAGVPPIALPREPVAFKKSK